MTEVSQPDPFESELLSIYHLDENALARLEQDMGLGGGGTWWIDPSQPPVELNAHGERDEGAILDVEAQVHAWLRRSFDKNPTFRDHNYHLLNRLNELARLQGLVEQAQLLQNSTGSGDQGRTRDPQLYHSTLSLGTGALPNLGASYDLAQPTFALHHFDVHRSLEGSLSQRQRQQGSYDYSQRGSYSGYGSPATERLSLSSSQLSAPIAHGSPYETVLNSGPSARPSGMPQMHKDQRNMSNHLNSYNNSNHKRPSCPGPSGRFPTPDMTSSPDRSHDRRKATLSRTYSKEQLELLKADDAGGRRKQSGSLLDSLQRFTVTSSLPLSDQDSDVDVTRSLDVPVNLNPLSQSLSEADMLHGSKIKPNASYSNMRSSDVLEMARLQESHLRKHSGSRHKLSGSNTSLTGSLLDVNAGGGRQARASSSAGSSIHNGSDVDLSQSHDGVVLFRGAHPPPERQITIRAKDADEPSEANRHNLVIADSGALTEPLDSHTGTGSTTDQNNLSEPSTPVVHNRPDRPDSFELLELRMSTDPASPGTLKVIDPDLNALASSNEPPTNAAANTLPVSDQHEVPETSLTNRIHQSNATTASSLRSQRVASPSPDRAHLIANKRPPMSPRVPAPVAAPGITTTSRLPTRAPMKSRIPALSGRSVPAPSQHPPSVSHRSRPASSESSAQSHSRSRSGAREPMTQLLPRNPSSGHLSYRNPSATTAGSMGSRTTNVSSYPTSRQSRSDNATVAANTQPKVTRSDTSPVRSTRMNNKRLGQRPAMSGVRRA